MVYIDSDLQRARMLYGIAQHYGIDVTGIQKGVSPEGVTDWYQEAHLRAMEERSDGNQADVDPKVYIALVNFTIQVSLALSERDIKVM